MTALLTSLKIVWSLVLPLAAGTALVARLLHTKKHPGLILALGYGCGMGLLGQWMLILDSLRFPLTPLSIGGPLALLAVGLTLTPAPPATNLPFIENQGPSSRSRALFPFVIIYLTCVSMYVFWRSLNIPILEWDAFSSIAFKAKLIYYNHNLIGPMDLPKAGYPLQVPYMLSWVAFNLGTWHEIYPKVIFPAFFLSFLAIFYSFLRAFVPRPWALGGLVLLSASNLFVWHATVAYRDFTVMFFNCSAIFLLILYRRDKRTGLLALAALFSGFSAFSKLEGSGYALIHLLLLTLILCERHRGQIKAIFRPLLVFIGICGGMTAMYYLIKILTGVVAFNGRLSPGTAVNIPERAVTILYKYLLDLFMTQNWNMTWPLLGLSLLPITKLRSRPEARLLLIALGSFFLMLFMVGLFTSSYIWVAGEKSATTLSRVILHFFPLAPALTVLLFVPGEKQPIKHNEP